MKKLIVIISIVVAMALPLISYAGENNNQNNSNNTTNNYNTTNQGGQGGQGGKGGEGGTAIGINSNKNDNRNTNIMGQGQGQAQGQTQGQAQKQGQTQGQLQGQSQSANNSQNQSANNEGVSLSVQQNYEADKREFLNAPPVPTVDPKLSSQKAGAIKTKGSLWNNMASIKKAQVDRVLNGAGHGTFLGPKATVDVRPVEDKDFQTDMIRLESKTPAGAEYLATIYVYSEGADSIALEAVAIREAMKLGGTHIVFVERDHVVTSDGKAWSVGLGGGASMMTRGDEIGIAPSGGLGISGAKASNDSLPQLLFTVYCDAKLLKQ